MNILILTQHGGHSKYNSLYAIVRELCIHTSVNHVYVASRSDARNEAFFNADMEAKLWGIEASPSFEFPADALFEEKAKPLNMAAMDALFLRLPHPVLASFFEFLGKKFSMIPIINRPEGILKTGDKSFLLQLDKRYTVPMALCNDLQAIKDFAAQFSCVLKPLHSYGGKGIIKVENDTITTDEKELTWDAFAKILEEQPQPYLAMQFLKQISKGDKRIVVAGGEILATSLRKPAKGGWLANVAQGGSSHKARPDARECEIVDYLSPILLKEGIFYYGLDTLVNDQGKRIISEINTLSIGGISPAEAITGEPFSARFADLFIHYIQQKNT